MKKCPKCNAVYPEEAVFCPSCGTQLVHANICPECGTELPDSAKFCPKCGHKMFEEVKQDVVDEAPGANSRYTEAEIKQMREELVAHRSRQRRFKTAGGILLGVGLPLFVLGLVAFIIFTIDFAYSGGERYASLTLMIIGFVLYVIVVIVIIVYFVRKKR